MKRAERWLQYEKEKAALREKKLSPAEYEDQIRRIAKRLKI